MSTTLIASLCALLYLAATGLQLLHLSQSRQQINGGVFALSLLALFAHALLVWKVVFSGDGLDLGFFKNKCAIVAGDQSGLHYFPGAKAATEFTDCAVPPVCFSGTGIGLCTRYSTGTQPSQRRHVIAHK